MSIGRSEEKQSLDFRVNLASPLIKISPREEQTSLLINHLLCIPSDNKILIFNTDTKTTRTLECTNVKKLIRLPGVGFASFSYGGYYRGGPDSTAQIGIWQVKENEIQLIGKSELFCDRSFVSPADYESMVASPDGRYLAARITDRDYYKRDHTVEIFLFDCLSQTKCFLTIPNLSFGSRYFNIVFTQPHQLAITHSCGWFSIYDINFDMTYKYVSLNPVICRREISFYNYDFYPSPNGKHWLIKIYGDKGCESFYLIDAKDFTFKLKQIFIYNKNRDGNEKVIFTQWLGDRIAVAVKYTGGGRSRHPHDKETIEIYDLANHQKTICDVTHIGFPNRFTITEENELFVLQADGQYNYFKLPESKLNQLMSQHSKNKETPFVKVLQETSNIQNFTRDIHFLIQEYAYEPMQSLFFKPHKTEMKKLTLYSTHNMVDEKIHELQKKKQNTYSLLLNKNKVKLTPQEDLQHIQLNQIIIDLFALHIFKKMLPKNRFKDIFSASESIKAIKKCIYDTLEKCSSKQALSYDLLQFFESINNSLGSTFESKDVPLIETPKNSR